MVRTTDECEGTMMAASTTSSRAAHPAGVAGRRGRTRTTILPPIPMVFRPLPTVVLLLATTLLLLGSTSAFSSTAPVAGPSRHLGPRATFSAGGGATVRRRMSPAASFVVVAPSSSSSRRTSRFGMTDVSTLSMPKSTTTPASAGWGAGTALAISGALRVREIATRTATAPAGRRMMARRRHSAPLLMSTGDTSDDDSGQVGDGDSSKPSGGIVGGSSSPSSPPRDTVFDLRTTLTLISAQALLIVCAAVLAVFLGTPNLGLGSNFLLDRNSIVIGTICTVPLFGLALGLDAVEDKFPPLKDVTRATQRSVLGLLGERRRPLLATVTAIALGLVAGLGEEMLFRGVLQTELCARFLFTPAASIALTSLAFGALHAVTPLYAILASLASAFFGVLLVRADGNLAVPIVCHGLYDVGALLWAHYVVTGMTESERREVMDWTP